MVDCRSAKLKGYKNKNIYISLGQHDIRDVKFFYVFCIKANQLFGATMIRNPLIPAEQKISEGLQGAHGVSSGPIILKDSRTVLIRDFSYDGAAPGKFDPRSRCGEDVECRFLSSSELIRAVCYIADAFFTVGTGTPSTDGEKLANEKGSNQKLPRYTKQTVMLTLPQDKSWSDYDYLSVFCHRARQDFAHVRIPREQLSVPLASRSGAYGMIASSSAILLAALVVFMMRH